MRTNLKGILALATTLSGAPSAFSAVVTVNVNVALTASDILPCSAGVSCYETGFLPVSPVTVNPGDTLVVKVQFAGGYSLQWANTGVHNPAGTAFGNEAVEVTAENGNDTQASFSGSYMSSFAFTNVTGDFQNASISWNTASVTENGLINPAYYAYSAVPEFSNSAFAFSGLTSTMGPIDGTFAQNNGASSYTVTEVSLVLSFGDFSFIRRRFTTFYNFCSAVGCADGSEATGPLIQAMDGNLYGTTTNGGAGFGTVFKLTPGGTLTTIHSFESADGAAPEGALLEAANGNFYGTTTTGGTNGAGTIFKLTEGGKLTTLYSFCSQADCADGGLPDAGLVQAANGYFYGTTNEGGGTSPGGCESGCGTIFRITPGGTLTKLYSFCSQTSCADGKAPRAGLIQANNGNFYGTSSQGGESDHGTLFEINAAGELSTLYSFCSQTDCADGAYPDSQLVQGKDGDLYGTTSGGGNSCAGASSGCGTVFKITLGGDLTTLHSFDGADGSQPEAGLIQATDGDFYGTTNTGGAGGQEPCAYGCGTLFKISPLGRLTTLHNFGARKGRKLPLMQDTNGEIYGATNLGGDNGNHGTVFSVSTDLGPFVETKTSSGKEGAAVVILGTSLSGASSVTFNGTPATFTVVSDSEISTVVPAGATTGFVEVTTTSGTLVSNRKFRIKP